MTLDGAEVRVRARRQGPRRQRAGHGGRALRARGPLLRHPRAGRGADHRAATSAPPAGRSRRTARRGRCRSRTARTPGTPSTTSPPTRRSTTSRVTVPSPWVGVANGELTDQHRGRRADHDHVAPGRAGVVVPRHRRDRRLHARPPTPRPSGVEISYWVPSDRPGSARGWSAAAAGSTGWRSGSGPIPFDSLGFLLVDSQSGMETQTMITLGDTDYTTVGRRCWCTRWPTSGTATRSRPTTGATCG